MGSYYCHFIQDEIKDTASSIKSCLNANDLNSSDDDICMTETIPIPKDIKKRKVLKDKQQQ